MVLLEIIAITALFALGAIYLGKDYALAFQAGGFVLLIVIGLLTLSGIEVQSGTNSTSLLNTTYADGVSSTNETITNTYDTVTGNTATILGAILLMVGFGGFMSLILRAWEGTRDE